MQSEAKSGSKSREWLDISVPIRDRMVHWPGDPEVRIEWARHLDKGDRCNASELHLGSHTGTHLDSPRHFFAEGIPVSDWRPEITIGPARVLELDRAEDSISESWLRKQDIKAAERLLFKTRNSGFWQTDPGTFHRDYVGVDPGGARFLAEHHCRCVGVDYLSVAPMNDEVNSQVHKILLGHGVWIIEGLDLSKVTPGKYELFCMPLYLEGRDGSPVRAWLRK